MGHERFAWDVAEGLASKNGAAGSAREGVGKRHATTGSDASTGKNDLGYASLSEARRQADDARQAASEAADERDSARQELLAAKDAAARADMELLDAEHAQADAEAVHRDARDRLNEAKEGRERLAEATSALDELVEHAMADARRKTKEKRETVLRLSRSLAASVEGREDLSTLLAAARWDLARAVRYEKFLPSLTSGGGDGSAVASYRASDADAVLVTSERKSALDEYDEARNRMLKAKAEAMPDEEFAALTRAETTAWEGVLGADRDVADARARLDTALAKEDAAWIRLDGAGRRLSAMIREAVAAEETLDRIAAQEVTET